MPIPRARASQATRRVADISRTLLLATVLAGCATKHVVPVSSTGTPSYKQLAVEYAVQGGTLNQILSVNASPDDDAFAEGGESWRGPTPDAVRVPATGKHLQSGLKQSSANIVDFDRDESLSTVEQARLTIEYPHPEERLGYALATLEFHEEPLEFRERNVVQRVIDAAIEQTRFETLMTRADQSSGQSSHGAGEFDSSSVPAEKSATRNSSKPAPRRIVLDIPRSQIDFLIMDLANSGFLDDQTRPMHSIHLDLRIDHSRIRKPWSREPRLDDIIHMVVEHGAEFDPARNEYHRRLPEKRRRSYAGRSSQSL